MLSNTPLFFTFLGLNYKLYLHVYWVFLWVLSPSLHETNTQGLGPCLFHLSQNPQHLSECLTQRKSSTISKQSLVVSVTNASFMKTENSNSDGLKQKAALAYMTKKFRGDVGFGHFWIRVRRYHQESPLCLSAVFCGLVSLLQLPAVAPLLFQALTLLRGGEASAALDLTPPHFMGQVVLGYKSGFLLHWVCFSEAPTYRCLTLGTLIELNTHS